MSKWQSLKGYEPEIPETGLVSGVKYLARNAVSTAIHGAERAAGGLIGDLPAAISGIPELIQQQITGKPSELGTNIYKAASSVLPTTENIRKLTRPVLNAVLPEGTLEPQSEGEKGWLDFTETLVAAMSPVGGIANPIIKGVKLGTAFLPAALGQLSKWGAEKAGFSKANQEWVKTGTMLATALSGNLGTQALFRRGRELYDTGEKSIEKISAGTSSKIKTPDISVPKKTPTLPRYGTSSKPNQVDRLKDIGGNQQKFKIPGADRIKVPGLEHDIDKALGIVNRINPRAHGAPEKAAIDFLGGLKDDIRGYDKTIGVEKIFPYKRLLNRLYYEGTPAQNKAFSEYLSPVKTGLKDVMSKYQKKIPAFKDFLEGDQLYAAAHAAQDALGYVQKSVDASSVSSSTTALLLGLAAPILKIPSTAYAAGKAVLGGAQGIKNAYNAIDVLQKSPAVRKHWKDVMEAALKQSATQLNKAVRALDEAVIKEEGSASGKWKPLVRQ